MTAAFGSGVRGSSDGVYVGAQFNEPNDVARAGRQLFVADTNNHRIRIADLDTGKVSTLSINAPYVRQAQTIEPVVLGRQTVGPGPLTAEVTFCLSEDSELNPEAESLLAISSGDHGETFQLTDASQRIVAPLVSARWHESVTVSGVVYLCTPGSGRCVVQPIAVEVPYDVDTSEENRTVRIEVELGV